MSKIEKIQGVRGMNDVLPADEALWSRLEEAVADTMRAYGYQRIRTPIVEHTRLFVRGIGEVTDIVEKEMYSFTDALNGEHLSLRPENTAGVVRAVIEHNLLYDGPKRLWYSGPMFRHERPQKGRYRQFHQVGAEALGMSGPQADAEIILLGRRLWDDLGLMGVSLEINSLGAPAERQAHRQALVSYLEAHRDQLDQDAQRRLHTNPLRILDTKNPAMQSLVEAAPKLVDFLGAESRAHFDHLQSMLLAQNLPYRVNPRLVRGLDYYNSTVFEWVAGGLTICGGGRYDPLIEILGGKPAPAIGMALGVERVLELMRSCGEVVQAESQCDAYVVHPGSDESDAVALQLAERMRDAGFQVLMHCGPASFKAQFRRADASGAGFAVILGEEELAAQQVSVKWLRDSEQPFEQGRQQRVDQSQLVQFLIDAIGGSGQDDDDELPAPGEGKRALH
jgi:histidyl-tRNA synthetase